MLKTAPCGRDSESVLSVYSDIESRDHRERSGPDSFSPQSLAWVLPMSTRGTFPSAQLRFRAIQPELSDISPHDAAHSVGRGSGAAEWAARGSARAAGAALKYRSTGH